MERRYRDESYKGSDACGARTPKIQKWRSLWRLPASSKSHKLLWSMSSTPGQAMQKSVTYTPENMVIKIIMCGVNMICRKKMFDQILCRQKCVERNKSALFIL